MGTPANYRPSSEELTSMTEASDKQDRTKTDASPESTWGATEDAKAAWDRKHGAAARKAAKDAAEKDKDK
jgi:hypothetical protein